MPNNIKFMLMFDTIATFPQVKTITKTTQQPSLDGKKIVNLIAWKMTIYMRNVLTHVSLDSYKSCLYVKAMNVNTSRIDERYFTDMPMMLQIFTFCTSYVDRKCKSKWLKSMLYNMHVKIRKHEIDFNSLNHKSTWFFLSFCTRRQNVFVCAYHKL
jgi:hypothetical protein